MLLITVQNLTFDILVLAVQNMEASGAVAKEQEIEFNALEGSLGMMSKGAAPRSYFFSIC